MASASQSRRRKRRRKAARCTKPKRRRAKKTSQRNPVGNESARRRRKATCRKRRKRKPAAAKPVPVQPVPPAPAPVRTLAPAPPASPIAVYSGTFGVAQAERLLWRAGFGPSPGHAEALAAMGLRGAVYALTRPVGAATLTGAEPTDGDGPLHPGDAWGHDHLWFLDRMVRTNQPLVERMTLIWHDWFANSAADVPESLMLAQNVLFRRNALGSFERMALEITQDPAMILFLNLNENTRDDPNENYARELMELFTLGADRGAYTEDDVRELARALTGWDNDWSAELGPHNFRFVAERHDSGLKTVFGQTGAFGWDDAIHLCLRNPKHASWFVTRLWAHFIPTPPSAAELAALEKTYLAGSYAIRPVVEAILMHPALIAGPRMVKPPVVYLAGMLRRLRRPIDTGAWVWLGDGTAQRLFRPPNVAGWDERRWLDTSTLRARWLMVSEALNGRQLDDTAMNSYDATETPEAAVATAREFWGNPPLTAEGAAGLLDFARTCLPASMAGWEQHVYRGIRQNALRQLIASCPDLQTG